jgi:glycosyltransferase 2 family protein
LNQIFKTILKFAFAIGIIYWLIQSGKLDFSLVKKSLTSGSAPFICLLFIVLQDTFSAIRWRWLLKTTSNKALPLTEIIKVTWIGLFFNSFLPGAVTGDFIKLLYARDLDKDINKTFLVTSVFMDRILGLTGLLLILGGSSLYFYNEVVNVSPQMKNLIHFNFILFVGAIVFVISLFLPPKVQTFFLSIAEKIPFLGAKICKTLKQAWVMGENKNTILKCILLSALLQFMSLVAFYIISSPFYEKPIPLKFVITFIPIGLMAVAIPISPAGLGVGHVIFDKLFFYAGISGGASFFNLYFLCMVFINSLGFIPYILSGKRHTIHEAEAEHFEDVSQNPL